MIEAFENDNRYANPNGIPNGVLCERVSGIVDTNQRVEILISFKEGITGCPLIMEHALSVLEVEVINQIDLGSHTIFI